MTSLNELKEHLAILESLRFELAAQRVEWYQRLVEGRNKVLFPKDRDITELDRKVRMDAAIAPIEADYEFLLKLEAIVEDRLKFGQNLL